MKPNYRYTMHNLSFDVTRRCNLSCEFCARGAAQAKDISRDVIDATLDQLKDVYIHDIRLSGGEPLLSPDMIEYVINGIVERNLMVRYITIFTNGTVYDNTQIDAALIKAADYFSRTKAEETAPSSAKQIINLYNGKSDVRIVISDFQHDNADCIETAKAHYNNLNANIDCVIQTEAYIGRDATIDLLGSAIDNAAKLFPHKIKLADVPQVFDNEFSFIEDARYDVWPHEPPHVSEIINISTDGTVTPGCLPAYDDIEAKAEFNIKDGDLLEYLDDFCWRHPATKGMSKMRQKVLATKILREKGIEVECDFDLNIFEDLANHYEAIHQIFHTKLPDMPRLYIDVISLVQLVNELDKNGAPIDADLIELIAYGFTNDIIDGLKTAEGRKKLVDDYTQYFLTLPQRVDISSKAEIADKALKLIKILASDAGNKNKIRQGSPQYFEYQTQRLGALYALASALGAWK